MSLRKRPNWRRVTDPGATNVIEPRSLERSGTASGRYLALTWPSERWYDTRPIIRPPMPADPRPLILRPGEGRTIDLDNFRMSVKASAEEADGAFTLLEAEEPPGFGPPIHIHRDAGEAFYVLAGEYIIFLGGEEHPCPAGSFIFIPAGVPHGFRVGAGAES
jgi:mannose-6-phosphate isomerase-like protein (cupin superfamily)